MRPARDDWFMGLAPFLPAGSLEVIGEWLRVDNLSIKLTSGRGQRLGAYKREASGMQTILLNRNQDPYSFLITLVHEIAHMQARKLYGRHVQPHGLEWKQTYSRLIIKAAAIPSLPADICAMMAEIARSPESRHYGKISVSKVLLKYSTKAEPGELLCDIPPGTRFRMPDGKVYIKGEKIRTRYRCKLDGASSVWLISGAVPVLRVA